MELIGVTSNTIHNWTSVIYDILFYNDEIIYMWLAFSHIDAVTLNYIAKYVRHKSGIK